MQKRTSKSEFLALLCFLTIVVLVLTNGFAARVRAQNEGVDVYLKLEPIGDVLDKILEEYYQDPNLDKVVEGALQGMMLSLDKHSSYISAEALEELTKDTEGEFEGIGVTIRQDEDGYIVVFQPLPESPAAKAGIQAFDRILKIDDVSTEGMDLSEAAKLIRGPRGTSVRLTVERGYDDESAEIEVKEIDVKRGTIPIESIKEARVLEGGIGYIRVSDFKKNTDDELRKDIQDLQDQGMTSLVLDLRWNSGGLLSASKEVCELFLPKNTLVTYTEGRKGSDDKPIDQMKLYTERPPVLPEGFPMVILVNEQTASSAEIVTGALQFWSKALILGETTYGKGSVQTIIPLKTPENSALRLTTALYYTPAEVTIHNEGIKPDIEVPMDLKQQRALWDQMSASYEHDPDMVNRQNHGGVTGNGTPVDHPVYGATLLDESGSPAVGVEVSVTIEQGPDRKKSLTGVTDDQGKVQFEDAIIEDVQLKRAVEVLKEDALFENLLAKYHKDTSETQVAATETTDTDNAQRTVHLEADIEPRIPVDAEPE